MEREGVSQLEGRKLHDGEGGSFTMGREEAFQWKGRKLYGGKL